jgi:predicted TIM-barrel fold metal-dependent hydrolase
MELIQKIDIHAHATAYPDWIPHNPRSKQKFLGEDELLTFYDNLNIEKGVLLPLCAAEGQWFTMTSENCKYLADRNPSRFLWFCGIDPRMGDNNEKTDLSYLIEHYKALGAKGVGELTAQLYADDPLLDHLYSCLEETDMPLTIHIAPKFGDGYGIVDELGLPRIEKMLKKHPKLKILGHSQVFWSEISADVTEELRGRYPKGKVTEGRVSKLMREYGNLYCDLSAGSGANAMMRDPEFAAGFIEEFSDRILYGCDICSVSNRSVYEFDAFLTGLCESGMISEENYRKIVRENAVKLLGL